jgi:hypothetical protein
MQKFSKINNDIVTAFKHVEINDTMTDVFNNLINRTGLENNNFVHNAPYLIFASNLMDLDYCMAGSTCVIENLMIAAYSLGSGTYWFNLFYLLENYVIFGDFSISCTYGQIKEAL